MTRNTITVESLMAKGYKAYEFGDYTLEDAVTYIKSGCECKLIPRFTGHMVAIITIVYNGNKYEKEMFSREMTPDEKHFYKEIMKEEKDHFDKVTYKISARNKSRMRRH